MERTCHAITGHRPAGLILATAFALSLLIPVPELRADIYRYVNSAGEECYTDAPVGGNATLVVKEKSPAPSHRQRPGKHPTAQPVSASTSPAPVGGGSLPVHGRITSLVGLRHDPIDGTLREHNGVDIAIPQGTPVRPVAPGTVIFSGSRHGYGVTVEVEHTDGTITLYAHNSATLVAVGDRVDHGTTIALSGSTGRSTGPHVHFEAWKDGVNVTSNYLAGSSPEQVGKAAPHALPEPIRRIVQADGSLLLTNLPQTHR